MVILVVVAETSSSKSDANERRAPEAQEGGRSFQLRHYVPADLLNVSFPLSVRGYDRAAVDAYIKRVNRVIAELKVSASPPAAVRHALEQAGEQVQGLLQAARETADEIIASGRREAEEGTAKAKAEAAELIVNTSAEADRMKTEADALMADAKRQADETVAKAKAEAEQIVATAKTEAEDLRARTHAEVEDLRARTQSEADELLRRSQEQVTSLEESAKARMRDIQADTEKAWKERGELLEDIRGMANTLVELAGAAANRFPSGEPAAEQGEETQLDMAPEDVTRVIPPEEASEGVQARSGASGPET